MKKLLLLLLVLTNGQTAYAQNGPTRNPQITPVLALLEQYTKHTNSDDSDNNTFANLTILITLLKSKGAK